MSDISNKVKECLKVFNHQAERTRPLEMTFTDLFLRLEEEDGLELNNEERVELAHEIIKLIIEKPISIRWGFSGGCPHQH